MKSPNLLVFGCPAEALRSASALGIRIVNFELQDRITPEKREAVAEAHPITWNDPSSYLSLALRLHRDRPFDGVVAFGEFNVYAASLVGEVLGIQANPLKSVVIAKDKALLRELLDQKGIGRTRFESITLGTSRPACIDTRAEELAARIGLPLILKPQDSSGSTLVRLCRNVPEIADYLRSFHDARPDSACIAEEYLDGPEISVETISFGGRHHLLAITEKETTGAPRFIETGHYVPASLAGTLTEQMRTEIQSMVFEILDAIGHQIGPGHTELKLTSNGPRLIETHTRPGGDSITSLVELSTGVNVFTETFRYLAYGKAEISTMLPKKVASSQFFLTSGGKCLRHEGKALLSSHSAVSEFQLKHEEGDELPVTIDSGTRAGHFVVSASSREEVDELVQRIRSEIRLS